MKKFYFTYIYPNGSMKHSKVLSMNTNDYSFNKLVDVLVNYNRFTLNITYII